MIEQDRGPSKKIPSNNFALLDKFDKAVEILSKQKNEDKLDRKGTAKFEEHWMIFFILKIFSMLHETFQSQLLFMPQDLKQRKC